KRGYQFIAPVREEIVIAPSASNMEHSTSVVGREAALSALDAFLNKALRKQRQVLFVTGEAGIGKTTLVDTFEVQDCRIPNLRLARGQCVHGFGGKEGYYSFLEGLGQPARGAGENAFVGKW